MTNITAQLDHIALLAFLVVLLLVAILWTLLIHVNHHWHDNGSDDE